MRNRNNRHSRNSIEVHLQALATIKFLSGLIHCERTFTPNLESGLPMREEYQGGGLEVPNCHSLIAWSKGNLLGICGLKNIQVLHINHQGHPTRVDATFGSKEDPVGNMQPPDS